MKLKRFSVRQLLVYVAVLAALGLARPYGPTYVAGCLLAAAGIAVRVWGCGHLRKNQRLTTSGPYGHVQHPLYLGTFLVAMGGLTAAGSPTLPGLLVWTVAAPVFLLAFFGYYLPKKKRVEGGRLKELFAADYPGFFTSVPAFMPSLRRWPDAVQRPWDWATFLSNHEWGMDVVIIVLFAAMLLVPRWGPWT